MNRVQVLETATKCVCGNREQDYGKPEDNFQTIANFWSEYLGGITITAKDVAMMMALMKIARIKTGTATEDSFVDIAGYAACGGEIATSSGRYPLGTDNGKANKVVDEKRRDSL